MNLDTIRSEIKDTDAGIMDLIRHRLELSKEVGKYKIDHDEKIRNLAVEADVVGRYRDFAVKNGMNPQYAEDICRILIKESVEAQESMLR